MNTGKALVRKGFAVSVLWTKGGAIKLTERGYQEALACRGAEDRLARWNSKREVLLALQEENDWLRFDDQENKDICEEFRKEGYLNSINWQPGQRFYRINDKGRELLLKFAVPIIDS